MIAVHHTTPSYIPALLEYLKQLGPETRSRFAPHAFDESTLHQVLEKDGRYIAFIARQEKGGPLLGYAVARLYYEGYEKERFLNYGWTPNEATDAFYAPSVADEHQGKGIGTLLLNSAIDGLKEIGRTRILLWGGVQASNTRALAHYRKNGFQEIGGFEWNGWNMDMETQPRTYVRGVRLFYLHLTNKQHHHETPYHPCLYPWRPYSFRIKRSGYQRLQDLRLRARREDPGG